MWSKLFSSQTLLRWRWVLFAIGIALTMLAFGLVLSSGQVNQRSEFELRATSVLDRIALVLSDDLTIVDELATLYAIQPDIEQADFAALALPLSQHHSNILALEWALRVPASQRSAYEQASGVSIWERAPDQSRIPALPREQYFPVHWAEPLTLNEAAIGFDLASEPIRREAIEQAQNLGQNIVTAPIHLVQKATDQNGVLILRPVYQNDAEPTPATLRGLVVAVVWVKNLVEAHLTSLEVADFNIWVTDVSAEGTQPLYNTPDAFPSISSAPFSVRRTLSLFNRTWEVVVSPSSTYLARNTDRLPWLILISGLVMIGSSLAVVVMQRRATLQIQAVNQALEARVQERTRQLTQQIGERQQAQAQLQAILDYSPTAIFVKSVPEGRYLIVNQGAESVLGPNSLGRTDLEIFPPEIAQVLRAADAEVAATQHAQTNEAQLRLPDGRLRDYLSIKFPIRDEQGTVTAVGGISLDITARKTAEQALQENRATLEQMVAQRTAELAQTITQLEGEIRERQRIEAELTETATRLSLAVKAGEVGLWNWDLKTQAVFFSPEWKAQIGYADDELDNTYEAWASRIHPEDLDGTQKSLAQALHPPWPVHRVEFRLRHKDGSYRWILAQGSLEFDAEGKPIRMYGSHTDITQNKFWDQSLLEKEEHLRRVVETALDAVITIDHQGRVTDWNSHSEAIFGWTAAEARGHFLADLIVPEEYRAAHQQGLQRYLATGASHVLNRRIELVGQHRTGRLFPIELAVVPITLSHGVVFTAFVRDITDRKEAERRVQAALHEKEILLKEIHHRVKNNLQVVSSLLYLQSQKITDTPLLELFRESQNRVLSMALIHEHLYQSANFARVDFGDYARTLLHTLFDSYGISSQQVTLVVETSNVQVDINNAIPCGLLLNEIVSNTLKYAFPAGRPGQITITLQQQAGYYHLHIGDDGVGLPNDPSPQRPNSLGMRLIRQLVNQLEGVMEQVGPPGTVYEIRFPEASG